MAASSSTTDPEQLRHQRDRLRGWRDWILGGGLERAGAVERWQRLEEMIQLAEAAELEALRQRVTAWRDWAERRAPAQAGAAERAYRALSLCETAALALRDAERRQARRPA